VFNKYIYSFVCFSIFKSLQLDKYMYKYLSLVYYYLLIITLHDYLIFINKLDFKRIKIVDYCFRGAFET